jgi:hypothetical protein
MSGTVSSTTTHAAIDGAWAVAIAATGDVHLADTTSSGQYAITSLPVGVYRAAFIEPISGAFEYWPNQSTFADGFTLAVGGGQDTEIDADL